jgi:hypothetical protein|tara:strand:+ start:1547 stop:1885 length:339 start_codon:yes stop_codon:yes gene_type:complete
MLFLDSEAAYIRTELDNDHTITIADMADLYNTSLPTMRKLVHGVTYRDARPSMCRRKFTRGRPTGSCPHQHKLGLVDKVRLFKDREKGESLRALGKKYNVSYQTIANYLKVM